MSSEKECEICCSDYSKFIKCNYCNFEACNNCQENYILIEKNPKCMKCNKDWSLEFVNQTFSKTFIFTKFKNKRKKDLFDLEKSLLPQSQKNIDKFNKIKDLQNQIEEYKKVIEDLNIQINILATGEDKIEKIEKQFIKNCPNNNCRGFLNQEKNVCSLCYTKFCEKCFESIEIKGYQLIEHQCNPDILESLKLIQKETKNCPKCHVQIFKIEGCDMMWCVNCKTPFNWKTGNIETGPIHNPHYFDYLFSQNENQEEKNNLDINCVELEELVRLYSMKFKILSNKRELVEFGRFLIHVQETELNDKYKIEDSMKKNEDIRQQYLQNKIDEKQFKSTLYRRFKKSEYTKEINQILDMFLMVSKQLYRKLYIFIDQILKNLKRPIRELNITKLEDYKTFLKEFENIQNYTREMIQKVVERYEFKMPEIDALNDYIIKIITPNK